MIHSIQRQLLLGLTLAILLAAGCAGVAIYYSARQEANELFDYQLRQAAMSLPSHLSDEIVSSNEGLGEEIVVQVWNQKAKLIYTSSPLWSLPRYKKQGFQTVEALEGQWRIYGETRRKNYVQIAQPISVRDYLAAGFAIRSLLPFFALIPAILLLAGFIVNRQLRPLENIAQAVAARTPHDLQPLPTQTLPTELATITQALNALLARLAQALSAQRAFIADAAHELRSPLTALKLQLQLAERAKTEVQRTQAIHKLHERLNRTIHLVEQMLTLARQEAATTVMAWQVVDLAQLTQTVVQDFMHSAEAKHITLTWTSAASLPLLHGDYANLSILLKNLLDNALNYTPISGRIDVTVWHEEQSLLWQVVDNGIGIAPQERERVFDRFYRCEGNVAAGTGLGLAIVRQIAQQHQATLRLADNPAGQGLVVTVIFPQNML